MKKTLTILIICLSFNMIGQNKIIEFYKKRPDAAHAHGSLILNETFYQVQKVCFKKQKFGFRLLISNLLTGACLVAKEVYDVHKQNPTGFSKPDLLVGGFQIPVYDIIRICDKDFKNRNRKYELY